MLSKLLKYEYKATARSFWGIYLSLLLLAVFMGVSIRFGGSDYTTMQMNNAFSGLGVLGTSWAVQAAAIGSLCYGALVIAMFVVLFITICQRFYRNLLGSEGYLMHTLPVKPAMLILSKLLITLFWSALSVVALLLSMLVLVLFLVAGQSVDVALVNEMLSYLTFDPAFLWVVFSGIGSYCATVLMLYLAMLIGHQFKKGALPISIIAYFLLGQSTNWLSIGLAYLIEITPLAQLAYSLPMAVSYMLVILLQFGFAALFFFCAEYLLRNRLNLV